MTADLTSTSTRQRTGYGELLSAVRAAGLLERRPLDYAIRVGVVGLLFAAGWAALVLLGDTWWQLPVGAYLAVVFAQVGFLGHDAGHRQIFRSRRANDLAGLLLGNLALGLAFGWWVDKHHRHHAHPNTEGLDPDIDNVAVVFTAGQADQRRGLRRTLARHQGALFVPMLLLEGLVLHAYSVAAVLGRGYRHRVREALLLAAHSVAYLGAVLLVLPPLKALAFVAVQQGLFGVYLGCAFAPNHKGMPILGPDDQSDFLRRQVLTSRNVRGGVAVDLLLGGLNYQIEHHLFPSMPRANLRRAQPIVRAFCHAHGLPYVEAGLAESYRQTLRHLHDVGRGAAPVTGA